jgi:hypothetical protein
MVNDLRRWVTLVEATESGFMRGGCFILALWLHKRSKLPLYGLWDTNDVMHHAFVYDPATDTAYDARGAHRGLENIKLYRGQAGAGTEVRPASVAEVQEHDTDARYEANIWGRDIPSPRAVAAFVRRIPALADLV